MRTSPLLGAQTDIAALILCSALFVASRDALAKYYTRTARLVGQAAEKGSTGDMMYNGNHEAESGGTKVPSTAPQTAPKPAPPPVKPAGTQPKSVKQQK